MFVPNFKSNILLKCYLYNELLQINKENSNKTRMKLGKRYEQAVLRRTPNAQ